MSSQPSHADTPGIFTVKCIIATIAGSLGLLVVLEAHESFKETKEQKFCSELKEVAKEETKFINGICWVNINNDAPALEADWVPSSWLD